jgi:hypothetical protein
MADGFRDCPHCHETLPERRIPVTASPVTRHGIRKTTFRRGLLYMMTVAFIYFLISPGTPLKIPIPFAPILTTYLLPLFFLLGLSFSLFGIYQNVRG